MEGDLIFWDDAGGIVQDWFSHSDLGLYVRFKQLDLDTWMF